MSEVKLLSEPTNYAVVHLPGRAYPGIVFQGDSLHNLIADLERARATSEPDERTTALENVIERLRDAQVRYEGVLNREGMSLPYTSCT